MTKQQENQTIESVILSAFAIKSRHLQCCKATPQMQSELLLIAKPFHEKLKELGYPAAMSKAMLKKAFNHQPPAALRSTQTVKIFD